MEELSMAAAAVATEQEIAVDGSQTSAGEPAAPRKQLSKVEIGERNLAAARSALEVAQAKVDGAVAKTAAPSVGGSEGPGGAVGRGVACDRGAARADARLLRMPLDPKT